MRDPGVVCHSSYIFMCNLQSVFNHVASLILLNIRTCYFTWSPSQTAHVTERKIQGASHALFPSSIISMTFSTSVCPTPSSQMTLKLAVSTPGPLHFLFPLSEMLEMALLNEVFSNLLSSFVKRKELYQKNLKEDVKMIGGFII